MFNERIDVTKLINIVNKGKEFRKSKINQLISIDELSRPANAFGLFKALKFYNENKFSEALAEFSKIERNFDKSAYVKFKIGMCHFKKGEWENALKYFEEAKKYEGYKNSWDVQYHAAIKHLNKSTTNLVYEKNKITDKNDKTQIFHYARELYKNKSYWLAIHILEEYLENNREDSEILFLLSNCYEILTDYKKSLTILESLIEKNPNNTNYIYRYAYNLELNQENDLANEFYQKFILLKISDDKELLTHGVGIIHAKRGLWDKALKAYKDQENQLEEATPASLYEKMAYAFGRLYLWEESAIEYKKAINTLSYAPAYLYFKCGEAYEKAEDYENSVVFYKKAIVRANDFHEYWYYRLGTVLEKTGNCNEANQYFKQSRKYNTAFGLNPDHVLKTTEQKMLSVYTEYYENLDIIENTILFESFFGETISCNPYALLCNFLLDEKFKEYTFIVVLNNLENIPLGLQDDRIIFIKRQSDSYLRYLASVKYLINNVSFPYYFIRKVGQYYLNTWHGTPLKTLGKDIKKPLFDYANVARNFLQATHIISQNRYTNDILLDKYNIKDLYSGKVADTGYPRVDLTLNLTEDKKQKIFNELGLNPNKPVVVYAPTWRGTSEQKSFDTVRLIRDLHYLKSDQYQLVFRCHHFAEAIVRNANLNVTLVPQYIDTNELLGCADILISDYSSIVFDFLHCKKPLFSYVYDFDKYVEERGLYVSKDELLGSICVDIKTLKKEIIKALNSSANYIEDIQKYAKYDDGEVSNRVKEFFFNGAETYSYIYDKKPVNLMFTGPYIPNGISRSFNNLLRNLQIHTDSKLSVIVNRDDILAHKSRREEFSSFYMDSVAYQARVGATLMSVEEIWIRNKFEEVHYFYSDKLKKMYLNIFARESRRLFGDTEFQSVINFEGYSIFWVSLLSQLRSKNKIVFQHNDLYQEWKTKYPYLQGVFNLYNQYSKIVSVSEMTMINNANNLAQKFNIPVEKFDFANNTILPEVIRKKSLDDTNIDPLFSEYTGKKILNIGRLSHEKDQEKLIRAFAQSKLVYQDVKLFLLGQGPLYDHLNNLITELNISDKVYLLGQVENPYCYLKKADLFVLSSNHEGQPMVLLEALTLGTPILATDIVGNRSILNEMDNCLVENSVKELSSALSGYDFNRRVNSKFDPYSYNLNSMNSFLALFK